MSIMRILTPKRKARIGVLSMKIACFFYGIGKNGILGKGLFVLYKIFLRLVDMTVLPVLNADVYKERTGNVQITTIQTKRIGVTANIIIAGNPVNTMLTEKPMPDLRLKMFKNVCIQGNSDVVVDSQNGYVISEEAYNLEDNLEIIDGLLYRTSDNICLLRDNLCHPKEHVESGIMISGEFCDNYYHLLYENLNKLVFLNCLVIPENVPIIIDRKTLEIPSCRRIFEILAETINRPVVTIESNKVYLFDMLYCLDHINKLPSHLKDVHKPTEVLYSPQALLRLREKLLPFKDSNTYPKRIFISRANTRRRRFNEEEVFEVLKKYGFTRIAPERYSLEEQIALFDTADYIVAGSGAALTNLLFVKRNCNVICFGGSTNNEMCDTPVFNTIANLNGANFYFFPRENKIGENVHANFTINCGVLENFVKSIIQ